MSAGNLSSFLGAGGTPIGGQTIIIDAQQNFVDQVGAEWLRAGVLKDNPLDYISSFPIAPQLFVYGSDSLSGSAVPDGVVGSLKCIYCKVGSQYVESSGSGGQKYATDPTSTWTACTGTFSAADVLRPAVNGTSYAVLPWSSANSGPKYTSNGTTWTAVGGTFTTFPVVGALAYGNSWWVTMATMAGGAGTMAYINNADPSGTWTVTTAPNIGGNAPAAAMAFGGASNWFVAVGTSASNTVGKIAICTTPSGTWTDCTSSSGIPFASDGNPVDVVFDGTVFMMLMSSGRIYTATNPTGAWTRVISGGDYSTVNFVGTTSVGMTSVMLATNGAGLVLALASSSSAPNNRRSIYMTGDGGNTWGAGQIYAPSVSTTAARASWASDKILINVLGKSEGNTEVIPFSPNYIGMQVQTCIGQYVRIK